jgi:ribonuclease BN (tRNA processing enzyme)
MKIEILGCYGNVIAKFRATSFLINDSILLDAGTVAEALDHERLKKLKQVVITHTHIDHLKGLFPLVDELVLMGDYSIELTSVPQVIDIISKNVFNNLIWPDFTVIPSENDAVISLKTIGLEETTEIDSITVKPILMTHTVYTVGYVIREGGRGFMFTADTGPTKRFWEIAREEEGIDFIIADVSFPNRLEKLAKISGHGTLSMLVEQLDAFGLGKMPVYITHIKPIFLDEIVREVASLGRDTIRLLQQDSQIFV